MKTLLGRLAIFAAVITTAFAFQHVALGQGTGTLSQLQQWVASSSPSANITQASYGKAIKITGLTTGQCLTLDANKILTTTACGSGSGEMNAVSTSTTPTVGNLAYWTSAGFPSLLGTVATGTVSAGTGISVTAGRSVIGGALTVTNDGVTSISATAPLVNNLSTGAVSLTCNVASGSQPGCLSSANWTTFNNKGSGTVTSIATTYPITGGTITTTGTLGIAFGTTTANTWAETQTFTKAIVINEGTTATSTFAGNVKVVGNLQVDGKFFAPVTLVSSGDATINGALTVTGATTLATSLTGLLGLNSGVTYAVSTTSMNASITGLAGSATALASDPSDCGANTWATAIATSGNLTCAAVTYAGISSMTSANLFGIISNETGGTGVLVGSISPALTGLATFAGLSGTNATSTGTFTLPVGASVITPIAGNIAVDTTSGQLRYSDVTGTVRVLSGNLYPSFTYSTTTWTGTTTIPIGTAFVAETWNAVQCFTDTGTLKVSFYDGTNRMNIFSASTTVGTVTLSTNNTFTASEKRYVDIGTPATSPKKITCTVSKKLTAD